MGFRVGARGWDSVSIAMAQQRERTAALCGRHAIPYIPHTHMQPHRSGTH